MYTLVVIVTQATAFQLCFQMEKILKSMKTLF